MNFITKMLPIVVVLLFTSCQKEEPVSSSADATAVKVGPVENPGIIENIEYSIVDGKQVKIGEKYRVAEFPSILAAVEEYKAIKKRSDITDRKLLRVKQVDQCGGIPLYCQNNGSELQGRNPNFVHLKSNSQNNPFATMIYTYDVKNLTSTSEGSGDYHNYKHINYNNAGYIDVALMGWDDSPDEHFWIIDEDRYTIPQVGTYQDVHTFFRAYDEDESVSAPVYTYDENAVKFSTQSVVTN